jgi:outer membrane receptor protein involved in Fe transport
MLRKTPLAAAIGIAVATSAISAFAQTPAGVEAEEEVIVTGSRIRQDTFSSSTPLDVVTAEVALQQGVSDLGQLLQNSTVALGSPQITAALSSAFVENGGTGVQTLSLRGLGPNRTLVLLNNRRAGPAGVRGGVSSFDFNVIPLSAIERVEILKDGASSVYGSDAVAGVVNIITKKDSGGTFDAYHSAPSDRGGEESRLSFSWGRDFSRGYFRLTGDVYEKSELAKGDRDYFNCGELYIFDPVSGQRADPVDPRTNNYWCNDLLWGHVWIYDYQDPGGNVPTRAKAQYDFDGDLGNYATPFPTAVDPNNPSLMVTPAGWFPVAYDRASDSITNADHPFQDAASLDPKTERTTFMGEGVFDFSDRLHGYTEVLLNRRKTSFNDYRQFWSYIYNSDSGGFFADNPLNAGWAGAQWLSPTAITDHADDFVDIDYQRLVVGLNGEFSGDWNWDISYQHSESDGTLTQDIIYDDSIWDQNWLDGPCAGTPTSVRGVPCVDVPWLDPQFLAGNISPQVREFLFGIDVGNTKYTQDSLEGYVAGNVGQLPAGPLGIAVGFQTQDDEIRDVPGENVLAGNVWGQSVAGITAGKDTTTAIFTELEVPLVAGKPWAREMTLNVSGRYTDVDSYGSDTTYKVGLSWQITDSWRIRANQGTSFRSPALFELYLADETGFIGQRFIDPCIDWQAALDAGDINQRVANNCAADGIAPDYAGGTAQATAITGGGYGILKAETSESKTFGIVWQPTFANLSISIDYFDITVDNEVDQLGPSAIVYGCYNSDFFPTDPLCSLFDRTGLSGGIDNVQDSFINIATQQNRGYDFAVRWSTMQRWGTMTLDTQLTRQLEDKKALFADTVVDYNGEVGDPESVARVNLTVDRGAWQYFWGMSYIGSASNYDSFGGNMATYRGEDVRVVLDTDAVMYHAFSVSRTFEGRGITARAGVANAFDERPPRLTTMSDGLGEVYTEGNSAFYSQYDWLGRRVYLNFTKTF